MIKNTLLSLLALVVFVGCSDDVESSNDYVSIEAHNQGAECLSCHGVGGSEANDNLFTSGASVYTALNGVSSDTYANDYTIRLVLENTAEEVSYTVGYGTGNSNTEYINSINSYTAKVIDVNGSVVNSSLVDSHNAGNLDCNSCHTSTGNSGAPGRIVSYSYY